MTINKSRSINIDDLQLERSGAAASVSLRYFRAKIPAKDSQYCRKKGSRIGGYVLSPSEKRIANVKPRLRGIEACVFDAYGTLFDVNAAAQSAQDSLGEKWQPLAELWRAKQLQYTWLRSLAGRHADFWKVTGDALDFALSTFQFEDPALRNRLMNLYLTLSVYPEVTDTLKRLKEEEMKLAVLSNGTPAMLAAAATNAGIAHLFDAVLSVEEVKVYKPHPSVYGLVCERLNVRADRVCFVSSNGWDSYSAKAFGFRVLWCNRFGQAPEKIPETPDAQIATLAELTEIVLDRPDSISK